MSEAVIACLRARFAVEPKYSPFSGCGVLTACDANQYHMFQMLLISLRLSHAYRLPLPILA